MTTSTGIISAIRLSALFAASVVIGSAVCAQSPPAERAFNSSKPQVDKAVQTLHSSASGPLPVLDGFVDATEPLDRYERGFYTCSVVVSAGANGGAVVRVAAKITAWYADPNPAKAGYRALPSNGRIETDFLARLGDALGAKSVQSGSGSTNFPRAPGSAALYAPAAAPAEASGASTSNAPPADDTRPASASRGAVTDLGDAPPPTPSPSETLESIRQRRENFEKQVQDLSAFAQNLEQIQQNQTHPSDLSVVKKAGTPVYSKPSPDSQVLFSAEAHDEFQVLDLDRSWVHVQISGASRGWIRRAELNMPAGFEASAESPNNAPPDPNGLFRVAQEETTTFAGDWQPLKGKSVHVITVTPTSSQSQITSPNVKREFAKTLFLKAYGDITAANEPVAGVVVVFDSADGGQIAATLAILKELHDGTLAAPAFWKQCSLEPPESFQDVVKP